MVYKEFIQKITDALASKKCTLKDVANYAGIDVSYLSRILSGKRNPPHKEEIIRKIAKYLNINEDELIFLAGKVPQKYQQYFSNIENISKLIEYLRYKSSQVEHKTETKKVRVKSYKTEQNLTSSTTPDELL